MQKGTGRAGKGDVTKVAPRIIQEAARRRKTRQGNTNQCLKFLRDVEVDACEGMKGRIKGSITYIRPGNYRCILWFKHLENNDDKFWDIRVLYTAG